MKIAYTEMTSNAVFFVAILGGTVAKMQAIALSQYGTLYVSNCYQDRGDEDYEAQAQGHLSILFLIANILSIFAVLLIGWLSDKVQIHIL